MTAPTLTRHSIALPLGRERTSLLADGVEYGYIVRREPRHPFAGSTGKKTRTRKHQMSTTDKYGSISKQTVLTLLEKKGRAAATRFLQANGYTFREADEYVLTARNSVAGQTQRAKARSLNTKTK